MKTLSIRQPWASLICAGIKDVENRTWKTNYRGKLLIHSSSYKCPKGVANMLPLEMGNTLINEDVYGNIDLENLPSSVIIGYVDLTDCVEGDYDSIWAEGECIKFVLENAYMFDEPITGVKGKLNIFDYDIDESQLPSAHKSELRSPRIEKDELVIPVANWTLDNIAKIEGIKHANLYETDDTLALFCNDKGEGNYEQKNLEHIKKLRVIAKDGREMTFKFLGIDWTQETDDNDKPISIPRISGEESEVWTFIVSFE